MRSLLLTLALGALTTARAAELDLGEIVGRATRCGGRPTRWVDAPAGLDRVRYASGLEADADWAIDALVRAQEALRTELALEPWEGVPVVLWLVTQENPLLTPWSGVNVTSDAGSVVMLFSPRCSVGARSYRTLVHELTGNFVAARVDRSPVGWTFYDAPSWFVQGIEEWYATTLSVPPSERAAAARAEAWDSPVGAIRTVGGALRVEEAYRDGSALIAFLLLQRGPDTLQHLLASDAPTFHEAVVEATGRTTAEWGHAYASWRGGRVTRR